MPLLKQIGLLTAQIDLMDKQIDKLGKKYPEISMLRSTPGVGPLVAACYVLTLDNPDVLGDNRQAGAFLGLRPRQSQSGDSDPQRAHREEPATATCAACWCSRRNMSWAALVPTRHCAAGA